MSNQNILFSDDAIRMNKRINAKENMAFPHILGLIQTCPIPADEYKNIYSFFSKSSLSSFPECDQVIEMLISCINDSDLARCSHGVKCIYYILCQKTFQFQPEFTLNLCTNLHHLIGCADRTVFCFFFKILYYISNISPDYSQIIKQMIPIGVLNNIILKSTDKKVLFSALNLFKVYILTNANEKEVYNSLCEVSIELINNNQDNVGILIEIVKLCLFYAQNSPCWATFFQPYHLFDMIISMFVIDSDQLKFYIIKLITCSFTQPQAIDNIDFQSIIQLINHNNPDLQRAAISCMNKCLRHNKSYLKKFAEMQLFENLFHCIQNGSFKARIECISIFQTILNNDRETITIYLNQNLLSILMELIPEVQDGSQLDKIFLIIQKMVHCVENLREKGAYQELVDQFTNANFEEVYDDFLERSQSVKNKFSQELYDSAHLIESFQIIMRSVTDMGTYLDSL